MEPEVLCPTGMQVDLNPEGTHALVTFTSGEKPIAYLQFEIRTLLQIGEAIPQAITDASGERVLGKRSALSADHQGPPEPITTHPVKSFVLVGQEAGGRAVDLLTLSNEIFRFLFLPDVATQLSLALAPGGDDVPAGTKAN